MALTCGFFNSDNGDRKYDATQFASLFDGVITDGVVAAVGEFFATTPGEGMTVNVGSGRAWFNRTWTYSDAKTPLTLDASDLLYDRIDAVVLEVDTSFAVRDNSIKVIKGTPEQEPKKPTLINKGDVHQYALAYIRVKASSTTIEAGDITINVGKEDCPFVTSIIETPELEVLFAQWDAQFTEWFENVQSQLEGDIAANLQRQIDERLKISDKATKEEAEAGENDVKWMTPLKTKQTLDAYPNMGKLKIDDTYYTPEILVDIEVVYEYVSAYTKRLMVSPNLRYAVIIDLSYKIKLYRLSDFQLIEEKNGTASMYDLYITDDKILILDSKNTFSVYSYNDNGINVVIENGALISGHSNFNSQTFIYGPIRQYSANYVIIPTTRQESTSHYHSYMKIDLETGSIIGRDITSYWGVPQKRGCSSVWYDSSGNLYFSQSVLPYNQNNYQLIVYKYDTTSDKVTSIYTENLSYNNANPWMFLAGEYIYLYVEYRQNYYYCYKLDLEGVKRSSVTIPATEIPGAADYRYALFDDKAYEMNRQNEINLESGKLITVPPDANVPFGFKRENFSIDRSNGYLTFGQSVTTSRFRKFGVASVAPNGLLKSEYKKLVYGG